MSALHQGYSDRAQRGTIAGDARRKGDTMGDTTNGKAAALEELGRGLAGALGQALKGRGISVSFGGLVGCGPNCSHEQEDRVDVGAFAEHEAAAMLRVRELLTESFTLSMKAKELEREARSRTEVLQADVARRLGIETTDVSFEFKNEEPRVVVDREVAQKRGLEFTEPAKDGERSKSADEAREP